MTVKELAEVVDDIDTKIQIFLTKNRWYFNKEEGVFVKFVGFNTNGYAMFILEDDIDDGDPDDAFHFDDNKWKDCIENDEAGKNEEMAKKGK